MKRWLILVAACGNSSAKEEPPVPVVPAYVADIDNLCNVVERSNSKNLEPNDKRFQTATWLGANIKTPEGHNFLIKLNQLARDAKTAALDGEAKRVGLAGCPLADDWRAANR